MSCMKKTQLPDRSASKLSALSHALWDSWHVGDINSWSIGRNTNTVVWLASEMYTLYCSLESPVPIRMWKALGMPVAKDQSGTKMTACPETYSLGPCHQGLDVIEGAMFWLTTLLCQRLVQSWVCESDNKTQKDFHKSLGKSVATQREAGTWRERALALPVPSGDIDV